MRINKLIIKNITKFYVFLVRNIGEFVYVLFSKTKQRYILLYSCLGNPISGDIYYLYEFLKKKDIEYEIKILSTNPREKKCIWINSIPYFYYLAKAKMVITNGHVQYFGKHKRKDTLFIDIWHGTPLKACMHAVKYNDEKEERTINMYEKYSNYHLSGSEYFEKVYLDESFHYKHEILKYGFFRNDCLIKKNDNNVKFSFPDNKINILFAPTWPEFDQDECINDFYAIIRLLSETFENANIIVRLHHLITQKMLSLENMRNVYDESKTVHSQELLIKADVLITDYSSLLFDYALLKKPVFLFQKNLEKVDEYRGLYIKDTYGELGIPTFSDVEKMIKAIKENNYNWDKIYEKYDNYINNYETGESMELFYEKFFRQ